MGKRKHPDIKLGDRFGRFVVIEGVEQRNKHKYINCVCDCGTQRYVYMNALHSGKSVSCGCHMREVNASLRTVHGMRFTKVYITWKSVKARTINKNTKSYERYGAVGIKMSPEFEYDFEAFFHEVGNPPDESSKWTLDRIDNDLGYVKGNMRWATRTQQARNKGKISTNTTGFVGVVVREAYTPNGSVSFVAHVRNLDGLLRTKTFSINKYGVMVAFREAVKWRIEAIEKLNQQDAGYTEKHGK